MKVNMTPNPLDVVTIHASQGDTEARQWEFELHNNGELIDTSDVKEQLVFKAYKGGTEQLLPENTSTPTTSPFIGDIRYPQGLLTDQEFTYRQSPTEEDGLAKITDIKGQTLKWNQLASVVGEQTGTVGLFDANTYVYNGHKYLMPVEATPTSSNTMYLSVYYNNGSNRQYGQVTGTTSGKYTLIFNCGYTASGGNSNVQGHFWFYAYNVSSWKNLMLFDLTAMGIDSLTDAEILQWFADYFPLNYYSFNIGSLIPFNGNGIKTVGKNLFDETKYQNLRSTYDYYDSGYYCRSIQLLPNTEYTISQRATTTSSVVLLLNEYSHVNESGFFDCRYAGGTKTYVTDSSGCLYIGIYANSSNAEANQRLAECQIQIEYGDTATEYEPYTESLLNLPISTYFPTGMKSAGNVYDELTPRKAITRIGAVDLGTLDWTYTNVEGHLRFVSGAISPEAKLPANNAIANAVCAKYEIVTEGNVYNNQKVGLCIIVNSRAMVYDPNYTDAQTFATAMSGVYLYYELATPTETSFTTASLVTENAEIPLSNNDGTLIGKCTEELSAEPGFHDAKIKLTDSDGTCYSNKLQLHVERSPQ